MKVTNEYLQNCLHKLHYGLYYWVMVSTNYNIALPFNFHLTSVGKDRLCILIRYLVYTAIVLLLISSNVNHVQHVQHVLYICYVPLSIWSVTNTKYTIRERASCLDLIKLLVTQKCLVNSTDNTSRLNVCKHTHVQIILSHKTNGQE